LHIVSVYRSHHRSLIENAQPAPRLQGRRWILADRLGQQRPSGNVTVPKVQGQPVGTHVHALSILAGDAALPAVQSLSEIQRLAMHLRRRIDRPEEIPPRRGAFIASLGGHPMGHRCEYQRLPPASTALFAGPEPLALSDLRCAINGLQRRIPVRAGKLSQAWIVPVPLNLPEKA